ncbi:hypothetical protein BgAZ_102590 [Babesia gibsoni]|uniref:Uncharacterized protein n=1 Tax=Babesia gibsoni TaxID=33632 RepID=A0AAD8PF97_BABGI|nr:hypothetical protein BgAZ_102590 [Babesia gibsoni]
MGDAIISLDEVIQFAYINNNEGNGGVFRHSLNPKGMFMDRPLHAYIHQFSRYGYEIPKETILVIQERYEDAKDMHGLFCEIMTQEELGHWNDFHRYCLKSDENFYFVGNTSFLCCSLHEGRIYANILASSLVRPEKLQELIQELSTFYGEYNMEKPIIRSICDSSYHSDGPSLMMKALDRISKEITNKTPHFANIILKPGYFQTLLRKIQLVAVEIEIENPLNNKLKVIMQDPDVRRRLEKQITNLKRDLFGKNLTFHDNIAHKEYVLLQKK